MKTNDRLLIIATAAYSLLFYKQNAGINFLLFDLVFIGVLLARDPGLIRKRQWLLSTGMCLLPATGILLNSSALAILANIFGLLLLSAYSFSTASSAIFSFLFSCYSVITSLVFVLIDGAARWDKSKESTPGKNSSYKYFTLFIVLLLGILFFIIYRQANPLFESNTQWVNFDFISFGWVIFTIAGFFIVYGLFYHKTILPVETWEQELSPDMAAFRPEREAQYTTELSAGSLLFLLLNLMLLVLNAGDINTIWLRGALPENISHSDFVHNGVGMIIFSVLIASVLIMYLFRFDFRKLKGFGTLKLLVYAWIVQNLMMLFSTAWRNQIYIHDYNLTYKRVGVYVWLILAGIGLVLTLIKIARQRSDWYLVRSNFAVWLTCLAVSSIVNWDVLITRYNLQNKPLGEVDFYYLFSLSESNIPELLEVSRNKDFHLVNGVLKNYTGSNTYSGANTFRALMHLKLQRYFQEYKSDWQSWDLRDRRILKNFAPGK